MDKLDKNILLLIQKESISQQNELQKKLLIKGIKIPQATLSRRLRKLNITKKNRVYKLNKLSIDPSPTVLTIKVSEWGVIVLHTLPGSAQSLAYYLDHNYLNYSVNPIIIGTIAGDDTVLVIIKEKAYLKQALGLLQALFPYVDLA